MKIKNVFSVVTLAAVASILVTLPASAVVAYSAPSATSGNSSAATKVGEEFTVNSALTVNELGAFNANIAAGHGNTWNAPISVAIYDSSLELLGAVTFSSSAAGTQLSGTSYSFQSLGTSLTLNSGTYFLVANGWSGTQNYYDGGAGSVVTHDTGSGFIGFDGSAQNSNLLGLLGGSFGSPDNRFGAGSFVFTAVPEVSLFGTAGVGLLGMVYFGRSLYLRRRANVA